VKSIAAAKTFSRLIHHFLVLQLSAYSPSAEKSKAFVHR
jgi:hypothetical protein